VQLHGGIGVTDELHVGHYFKRLTCNDLLLGDAPSHLQRFADADPALAPL
jgi:acyl-CoA dehydrogenase